MEMGADGRVERTVAPRGSLGLPPRPPNAGTLVDRDGAQVGASPRSDAAGDTVGGAGNAIAPRVAPGPAPPAAGWNDLGLAQDRLDLIPLDEEGVVTRCRTDFAISRVHAGCAVCVRPGPHFPR